MTTGTGMHASVGAAGDAVKRALFDRMKSALWDAGEREVDTEFGFQFSPQFDDLVAVTAVRVSPEEGTLGPRRRRHMDVSVDMSIVVFRVTADEAVTHARAYALLDVIDQAVRADPTLDGAALWCMSTDLQSDGATTEEDASAGRVTEIAVTYAAQIIVTS